MFLWWYSHGWAVFIQKVKAFIVNTVDFFSMSSLLRTLFQPYRQISAESASADSSLDLRFQMFIDRLVSRTVGFFTRLILLFVGTFLIIISAVASFLLVLLWPVVPLLPALGIIMTIAGLLI